jgi:hypothetical protein
LTANKRGDRLKFLALRGSRHPFDRVVELDDVLPDWCHRRAAALHFSVFPAECRLLQSTIYLLDQEPCGSVAYAQISRGRDNRSLGPNCFEECDSPGPIRLPLGRSRSQVSGLSGATLALRARPRRQSVDNVAQLGTGACPPPVPAPRTSVATFNTAARAVRDGGCEGLPPGQSRA